MWCLRIAIVQDYLRNTKNSHTSNDKMSYRQIKHDHIMISKRIKGQIHRYIISQKTFFWSLFTFITKERCGQSSQLVGLVTMLFFYFFLFYKRTFFWSLQIIQFCAQINNVNHCVKKSASQHPGMIFFFLIDSLFKQNFYRYKFLKRKEQKNTLTKYLLIFT